MLVQGDPLFPYLRIAKFSLRAEFQYFLFCPWSLFGAMMRRCVAAGSCFSFLLVSFSLNVLWGVWQRPRGLRFLLLRKAGLQQTLPCFVRAIYSSSQLWRPLSLFH